MRADYLRVYVTEAEQMTARVSRLISMTAVKVASPIPVDVEINSKIYLWRGNPWNLEVDVVVNSTIENMDKAHYSPGLHDAVVPGLAEECATMVTIRIIKFFVRNLEKNTAMMWRNI
ncbi:putative Macro domain-containing protein [Helianthus anomalus]